jgi:flagellar protein FliO/FliZ
MIAFFGGCERGRVDQVRSCRGAGFMAAVSLALTLLFAPLCVRAADDSKVIYPAGSAPAAATSAASSSASGGYGNVTLLLGVVLAAAGAWFVWRGRRSPALGRDARQLTLGETRSLGNRQYLVVATYEDKKFLLGVCPGRIDLLAPLHEEKPRA